MRADQSGENRKPAAWIYYPAAAFFWLALSLLCGLRVRRDPAVRRLRGPLLILGNHPSYLDPMIMAAAMWPRRIHFLTSHGFFRSPLLRRILTRLAAIPKVQFRTDSQALKNMFRVIRCGGDLGIYPEGQRSLDGGRQPVDEAIAKLAKKLRCPVVAVLEDGGYLTWPRWSQSAFRCGRIEARVKLVLKPEELESLETGEIQNRITAALDYQDYEWQRRRRHAFLSRSPALGLHNLCHQCPACGRVLAMESSRRHLTCRYCGWRVRLDRFGFFQPAGRGNSLMWAEPHQWHQWQLKNMADQIRQPGFKLEFAARAEQLADDGSVRPAGQGMIRLTADEFRFIGLESGPSGEPSLQLTMPIRNKTGISADYGLQFEIACADQSFRFVLDQGQAVIMIADAIRTRQEM